MQDVPSPYPRLRRSRRAIGGSLYISPKSGGIKFMSRRRAARLLGLTIRAPKSNSRQCRSCKDTIMYERDVNCQMKQDAEMVGSRKSKYTGKSRRLFNQGLSNWSLTVYEDVL